MTVYDTTSPPKATLLRSAEDLQLHEFAQLFPPLEGEEYEALKADIAANGLREPIRVYGRDKKLLEGRNRYRAALELNRFIQPVMHPAASDAEALEFVLAQSRHRDCLTQEQFDKITALRASLEPARKKLVLGGPPSDEDSVVWLAFHARLTPLKVAGEPAPAGANPPPEPAPAGANPPPEPAPAEANEVLAELRALRAQVTALQEQVALLVAGQAPAAARAPAGQAPAAALHPLVAAAQARGVSRRTLMTARRIVRDGAPCVVDAALSGALSLHKAGGICTYSHEVQVQICTDLHLFAPAGANPVQIPECNLHLPGANEVQTGANPPESGANEVQTGANEVQIEVQTPLEPVQTGANQVQTGANEVQIPVQTQVQTGANEVQTSDIAPDESDNLHLFAPAGANPVQTRGEDAPPTWDSLPPSMRTPPKVESPPKPLDNLYELLGIEQPPEPPDARAIVQIEEKVPVDESNPIFRRGDVATLGWMNVTEAVAATFKRPVDLPVKPGRPPSNAAQPNHPHFMTHFYDEWLRTQGSSIAEEERAGRLRWEDPPEGATLCRAWVCPERAGPFTKHLLKMNP